jgi:hypothetical protein
MLLLKEADRKYLSDLFARELENPLEIVHFTQRESNQYLETLSSPTLPSTK